MRPGETRPAQGVFKKLQQILICIPVRCYTARTAALESRTDKRQRSHRTARFIFLPP